MFLSVKLKNTFGLHLLISVIDGITLKSFQCTAKKSDIFLHAVNADVNQKDAQVDVTSEL